MAGYILCKLDALPQEFHQLGASFYRIPLAAVFIFVDDSFQLLHPEEF